MQGHKAMRAADPPAIPEQRRADWREKLRDRALRSAIEKRSSGVPTYSVSEAAALLSISQEYLYRLIQAGAFPVVRMRHGGTQGRYVIPAGAVEELLKQAEDEGGCIESADWSDRWHGRSTGGAFS